LLCLKQKKVNDLYDFMVINVVEKKNYRFWFC
jgi:hypothetical protein